MHEHYAIIDGEIVWYGSMNLLSGEKEDDNLMRVESKDIAQELSCGKMPSKSLNREESSKNGIFMRFLGLFLKSDSCMISIYRHRAIGEYNVLRYGFAPIYS